MSMEKREGTNPVPYNPRDLPYQPTPYESFHPKNKRGFDEIDILQGMYNEYGQVSLLSPKDEIRKKFIARAEERHYLYGKPKEGEATKEEMEIHDRFLLRLEELIKMTTEELKKPVYGKEEKEKIKEIYNREVTRLRQDRDEDIAELYEEQNIVSNEDIANFQKKIRG